MSSSQILQMNSETGVAFAKNSGTVVVYYRLEGGQQTFREVISLMQNCIRQWKAH